jgi:hypothetical protein
MKKGQTALYFSQNEQSESCYIAQVTGRWKSFTNKGYYVKPFMCYRQ